MYSVCSTNLQYFYIFDFSHVFAKNVLRALSTQTSNKRRSFLYKYENCMKIIPSLYETIFKNFFFILFFLLCRFCFFIGIEAPDLTPTQQNMAITQRAGSFVKSIFLTIENNKYDNFYLSFYRVELLV